MIPLLQSGDIVVAGNSAIKAGFNAILKALLSLACLLSCNRILTRTVMSANLAKDPNRRPEGGQLVLAAQSLPAARDPVWTARRLSNDRHRNTRPLLSRDPPRTLAHRLQAQMAHREHRSCHSHHRHGANADESPALYGNGSPADRSQRREDRQHRGRTAR